MNRKIKAWVIGAAALGAAAAFGPAAWAGCGDSPIKTPAAYTQNFAPIVGMWSFTMYAANSVFDTGYTQWHSDGTEIENSAGRSPASENFCLGVWGQLGPRHFALNHFALSYDPASGKLNAKINFKEDVNVDASGNAFSGTFVLDAYDPTSGKKLQEIRGTVVAQRITL